MVWQQPNLRMQRSARSEIVPLPLTPLRAPADAGVVRLLLTQMLSFSKHIATLVALLLCMAASVPPKQPEVSGREYEIYRTLLSIGADGRARQDRTVVVRKETNSLSSDPSLRSQIEDLREQCPDAPESLWTSFGNLDQRDFVLKPDGLLPLSAVALSSDEIRSIFRPDREVGWKTFHERFPRSGGMYGFSLVAFDRSGEWAALYVTMSCGGLCGTGDNVVLHRGPTGWREVGRAYVWVS